MRIKNQKNKIQMILNMNESRNSNFKSKFSKLRGVEAKL